MNALNSSALPLGSWKNIVACSPTWPAKRMPGSMPNATAGRAQPLGERVPRIPFDHHAEMRHGHVVAVDRVVDGRAGSAVDRQVRDELVAEEVEVDPLGGAAAFGAAEQLAIEPARVAQAANGYGQMERLQHRDEA